MHLATLLPFLSLAVTSTLADGTIHLPYVDVGSVQGITNSSGTLLAKPVVGWFSIPYAAPPTGDRRFKRPEDPVAGQGFLNLTTYGAVCPQGPTPAPQSEDCLTLSVFRPGGMPNKKLPVVIWVPGGAFNTGSGSRLNIPSLVGNAPDDFIGVSINYRLGALGGIPSLVGKTEGAINLGLYDQAKAFEWVQEYISAFGGDPKQVTLFGESAGAHSVGAHLQHPWSTPAKSNSTGSKQMDKEKKNNGRPFARVIMNSGGPAARAWPDWTWPLYNTQAEEFFNRTGCSGKGNEVWGCLRALDVEVIRNASVTLYNQYNTAITWPFQPIVDNEYVTQAPSQSWKVGQFERVPVITGFNTDEGTGFVPRTLQTNEDFEGFFRNLLPLATESALEEIVALYPDPVTDMSSSYSANSSFGAQWNRTAAAYGDYAYVSTVRGNALGIAGQMDGKAPVWKYHFNRKVAGPPGTEAFGVGHASELGSLVQVDKSETATKFTAYYSSFVVTGDPNARVPKSYPQWPEYKTDDQREILFGQDEVKVEADALRTKQQDWWLAHPEYAPH